MNPTLSHLSDPDLLAHVRAGERHAFAELVRRHQSLVCAQAYAVCGDFSCSEEIAQEAFIAAWRQLGELRDTGKFKSWLCTIARRLALRVAQKRDRPADARAVPLGSVSDPRDPAPSPHETAASREESALVWSALETIPAEYREPLVLFYREGNSIAAVATALQIREDAARQRLVRGRAMLRDELATVVESTLARTRPGPAFTLAVLAAIPGFAVATASAATAASIGTATKGAAVAKASIATGLFGGLIGAFSGLAGAAAGSYASAQTATYARERTHVWRQFRVMLVITAIFCAPFTVLFRHLSSFAHARPQLYAALLVAWILSYILALLFFSVRATRNAGRIHAEEKAAGAAELPPTALRRFFEGWQGRKWQTRATLLGLPLIDVHFAPMRSLQVREIAVARGWIAIGDRALGILFAFGNVAIGGIAFGGVSAGLISFGGLALGGLALGGASIGAVPLGGIALGVLAFGGLAVGWCAFGGGAVAWHAALGAAAWAHDYAVGASAIANHANDAAARAYIAQSAFFQNGRALADNILAHQTAFMLSTFAVSIAIPLAVFGICYRFHQPERATVSN
jgi:RNA polymerase sigma factor (sigma-70 family)